jgi:hypothetical protein
VPVCRCRPGCLFWLYHLIHVNGISRNGRPRAGGPSCSPESCIKISDSIAHLMCVATVQQGESGVRELLRRGRSASSYCRRAQAQREAHLPTPCPYAACTCFMLVPRRFTVVMDGNGRWASSRGLPRVAGHRAGVHALRRLVSASLEVDGLDTLTVFALSSENWLRPRAEVTMLLQLIDRSVQEELDALLEKGVQLRFIGGITFIAAPMSPHHLARVRLSRSPLHAVESHPPCCAAVQAI